MKHKEQQEGVDVSKDSATSVIFASSPECGGM